MGMQFNTGIDFKYNNEFDFSDALEIPSDCAFSNGSTLATSERYSHDYTNTSQSITRCVMPQAKTYSIAYRLFYPEKTDLFAELASIEDAAGRTGELYFCGHDFGLVLVQSVSIALEVDGAASLTGVNATLNIIEAIAPVKPAPRVDVRTLRR